MTAHDTGHRYIDEKEIHIDSLYRMHSLMQHSNNFVLHCPALCRYLHMFSANDTAVVLVRRSIEDIIASQERIDWNWDRVELARYDRSDGIVSEVKYQFWDENQRHRITHAYEIEYESLSGHPLWLSKDLRANFEASQTSMDPDH